MFMCIYNKCIGYMAFGKGGVGGDFALLFFVGENWCHASENKGENVKIAIFIRFE